MSHVTPNGLISSDTQTAYVLALQFDMLPENLRQQAADRLVSNIVRYDNHLDHRVFRNTLFMPCTPAGSTIPM